jgi:2-methylcitrate dehydratase
MSFAPSQTAIAQLVSLTQNLPLSAMSTDTVRAAKRAILDALGCAIAAVGCEPARIAGPLIASGSGSATVIGETGKSTLERAVLLNGIMLRYLDMMDVYWAQDVCHPAENVPLALAGVESAQGGGRQLIEAVVAGYEGQMRLTHLVSLQSMGMHHVTASGIVAPLVLGRAWELPADIIEQAVALSGCRQFTVHALSKGGLSMAKAIGYAWSAMDSILAVRLAQGGFTGPVHFLDWLTKEGPLTASFDSSALAAGGAPLIERTSFKQFPVQFELQTPNEVAIRLHKQIAGQAITRVEIAVQPIAAKRTGDKAKFTPANRETADHSLPVTVAMSLLDGKLTAAQFEHDRWADADVAALVARTTVVAEEALATTYPQGRPARITIELANGTRIVEFQEVPYGDVTRPLDDDAIEQKFLANAQDVVGADRAQAIVECVRRLEHVVHIDELTRLLAAA